MSINKEISERIKSFSAELEDLIRKAAIEAVAGALGDRGAAAPAPAPAPARAKAAPAAKAAAPAAKAAPKAAPKAAARKPGGKRTQAELKKLEETLVEYVGKNPGQNIEAIGKALSLPTGELQRPMFKLIERGAIRRQGERRGTRYFAGGATKSSKK